MNKNNILKNSLIIILILLLWQLSKNWLSPFLIKQLGGYTSIEYKETIDTLNIKYDSIYIKYKNKITKVDTLNNYVYVPFNIKSKDNTSILPKGELENLKTIFKSDSTFTGVYITNNPINDSIIEGKIKTVINPSNCQIIAQNLEYTPKIPIIVEKTITVEKIIEKILKDNRNKIGFGIETTSSKRIGIQTLYQTKTNWQFQIGLLYNTTNNYTVDNNTKEIKIGITKLF